MRFKLAIRILANHDEGNRVNCGVWQCVFKFRNSSSDPREIGKSQLQKLLWGQPTEHYPWFQMFWALRGCFLQDRSAVVSFGQCDNVPRTITMCDCRFEGQQHHSGCFWIPGVINAGTSWCRCKFVETTSKIISPALCPVRTTLLSTDSVLVRLASERITDVSNTEI